MKHIERIGGVKRIFWSDVEYAKHLDTLTVEKRGARDRARSLRPEVCCRTTMRLPGPVRPTGVDLWKRYDLYPLVEGGVGDFTFSLIHPSRGRPIPALEAMALWLGQASKLYPIEYILSLDHDDAYLYLDTIKQAIGRVDFRVVIHQNRSLVDAVNRGAEQAGGDVLVFVSDDFECPDYWDQKILEAANGRRDPWCLFVRDGYRTDGLQCMSIMSRAYYEQDHYMYYPEYKSMYADNDYTEHAMLRGQVIHAEHLLFRHNHYVVTGVEPDETYRRENQPAWFSLGKGLLEERRRKGFAP